MRDVTIQQARAKLESVGKSLRAGSFTNTVYLVTTDSANVWESALAKRYGEWVLIWTEHHGYRIEHRDEILHLRMFKGRGSALPQL